MRNEGIAPLILNSVIDGVDVQSHAPTALATGKIPGTHFTGGCVGPIAGLDGCGGQKICCFHRVLIYNPPACRSLCTLFRSP
jgi:hypothetical protein